MSTSSPSLSVASLSLSGYSVGVLIPWALITPLQFGQHIAALNQISNILTCKVRAAQRTPPIQRELILRQTLMDPDDCVPMSDATFSAVTSVFMIVCAVPPRCARC